MSIEIVNEANYIIRFVKSPMKLCAAYDFEMHLCTPWMARELYIFAPCCFLGPIIRLWSLPR